VSKQNIPGRKDTVTDGAARAHTRPTQLSTPAKPRQQIVDEAYQRTPTPALKDCNTPSRKGQS